LGCDCYTINRYAHLSFQADGTVVGSDSTNTWDSHFSTSDRALRIAPGSSTLVGLTNKAPAVTTALQAAYAALMRGGKVDAEMLGATLALTAGNYTLVLARARPST
jgi:hypothetical protein